MLRNIVVTGGSGRFAQELKKIRCKYNFIFRNKKQLDILSISSIKKNVKNYRPDCILHLAGLSRPMSIHNKNIKKSIDLNIIGTANLVKVCSERNIKIIFFSTNYVYPGKKGNYKEQDAVLPWNNYGWSKLGAESAVQMYKNSLIIRACMTEKPFFYKKAYTNLKTNFMFHEDLVNILPKIIHKNEKQFNKSPHRWHRQLNLQNSILTITFSFKHIKNIMPGNSPTSLIKLFIITNS